jgi:hypothetical protein
MKTSEELLVLVTHWNKQTVDNASGRPSRSVSGRILAICQPGKDWEKASYTLHRN